MDHPFVRLSPILKCQGNKGLNYLQFFTCGKLFKIQTTQGNWKCTWTFSSKLAYTCWYRRNAFIWNLLFFFLLIIHYSPLEKRVTVSFWPPNRMPMFWRGKNVKRVPIPICLRGMVLVPLQDSPKDSILTQRAYNEDNYYLVNVVNYLI